MLKTKNKTKKGLNSLRALKTLKSCFQADGSFSDVVMLLTVYTVQYCTTVHVYAVYMFSLAIDT
jgi:hypothetical protein